MKPQTTFTANDDADYIEACRVQSELGAKHKAISDEIAKEQQQSVSDVVPDIKRGDVIGQAMALEPGVAEEERRRGERLAVLRAQQRKVEQALTEQAELVYQSRRRAGYRAFAKDDGGYLKAVERLLVAVDSVIAMNKEAEQRYRDLYARGCDEVMNVLFPTPSTASDMERWRDGLADSLNVLKQTATTHATR